MLEKILIGIVVASFTALIVYTINQATNNKRKDEFFSALREHAEDCPAGDRISRIERAVIFLVVKSGGNLQELGLMK